MQHIIGNPAYFPTHIDIVNRQFVFTKTSREELAAETFLTQAAAIYQPHREHVAIGFDEAAAKVNQLDRQPALLIFHTSFCGSTILSQCLDCKGHYLSISEPDILMQLANQIRMGQIAENDAAQMTAVILKLLANAAPENEQIIIKPTNSANRILQYMPSDQPAVLLYGIMEDYLGSILKKGEEGRGFTRNVFNILSLDFPNLAAIDDRQKFRFTDLQVACFTWHLMAEQYHQFLNCHHLGRTLSKSDLLNDLLAAFSKIQRSFNLTYPDSHTIHLEKNIIHRHAKHKTDFSVQNENQTLQGITELFQADINTLKQWQYKLPLPNTQKSFDRALFNNNTTN